MDELSQHRLVETVDQTKVLVEQTIRVALGDEAFHKLHANKEAWQRLILGVSVETFEKGFNEGKRVTARKAELEGR